MNDDVAVVPRPVDTNLRLEGVPAFLERIYLARGVRSRDEVDHRMQGLLNPSQLRDVDIAAQRIVDAIQRKARILIIGDFDADGATASALAVLVLRAFGHHDVDYLVPNRFEFGYGLSPEIVDVAAKRSPDLLITVDNGVSSVSGVARARELGIDVVITDHHLPGNELPAAFAIVNPNHSDCGFPSKAMAGVGVIYYLLSVVRAQLSAQAWFKGKPPNLADYLDLVALGTVADVVPLDRNNRILVYQGLLRIRQGRCRPGIKALCERAKRDLATLETSDLGFAIGPRINAAGRLSDMSMGIRCLLAETLAEARTLASALDELNVVRRELEQDMVSDAELIVAGHQIDVGNRFGVCVYDESWHQGVVGIVAGRLREKLNRPVVAFAEAGTAAPDELKGSGRSLPGLHLRDVLAELNAQYPGMLGRFGGHAMAAGLNIKRVHYPRFAMAFDQAVASHLDAAALSRTIVTDGELATADLNLDVAQVLTAAGPWGQAFPEPQFHGEFDLVSQRIVGEHHLKLVVRHGGRLLDAIAFRRGPLPDGTIRILLVYRLQKNDYGQYPTLQLVVEHLKPLP
ncbi:MAG: single-stranded-DNA-specific exonuclease RecJ [Proteobacteria bacterium]|nr:single-stranded-DNA-specific exonuclease RecJ [Pseudomonadota bacterium]